MPFVVPFSTIEDAKCPLYGFVSKLDIGLHSSYMDLLFTEKSINIMHKTIPFIHIHPEQQTSSLVLATLRRKEEKVGFNLKLASTRHLIFASLVVISRFPRK